MERKPPAKLEIAALVLAIIFPTLLTYVYFVHLAGAASSLQQIAYGIGKTIQFALPIFWIGIACRERWLVRSYRDRGVVEGILFGAAVFLAMFYLYTQLQLPGMPLSADSKTRNIILDKVQRLNLNDGCAFILLGLFYSVIHSGLEEYYWRWFVFGRLRRFMPWLLAALISSIGFMAHHVILLGTYFGYNSVYCWLGSLAVAVGGFYWAWLYKRSDSIWGPWVSHGIVDAAIFSVGYMIVYSAG